MYGGLLHMVTDFCVVLSTGGTRWDANYGRYIGYSFCTAGFYSLCLPHFKWNFAKDQYKQTTWKLHSTNLIFFAWFLPVATFSFGESIALLSGYKDPLAIHRFHTMFATGFIFTMIMEVGKVFEKYRLLYLQEFE